MSPLLFLDTESTGLFNDKLPANHEDQPRMVSIGAILCDFEGLHVMGLYHALIVPDGFSVEDPRFREAFEVHRMTDAMLQEFGVPIGNAMNVMCDFLELEPIVVAHNVQHDLKLLRGELRRASMLDYYNTTQWFDTAHASTQHCKLPRTDGKNGFKLPKMGEAYEFWLKQKYTGAHGSFNDALGVKKVFGAMRKAGIDMKFGQPKGADEKRHAPAPQSVTPAAAKEHATATGIPVKPDDADDITNLI